MEKKSKPPKPILSMQVSAEQLARVDELARSVPFCNRSQLSLIAMRIGLRVIEQDPSRVIAEARAAAAQSIGDQHP